MIAKRTQCRQPADQQELISRINAIEAILDAMVADRKWIVSVLADLAVELEVRR